MTLMTALISTSDIENEMVHRLSAFLERVEQIDASGFYFTERLAATLWGKQQVGVREWAALLMPRKLLHRDSIFLYRNNTQTYVYYTTERDRSCHVRLHPTDEHRELWHLDLKPLRHSIILQTLKQRKLFELVQNAGERGEAMTVASLARTMNCSKETVKALAANLLDQGLMRSFMYKPQHGQTGRAYATTMENTRNLVLPGYSTPKKYQSGGKKSKGKLFNQFSILKLPSDAACAN